MSAYRVLEQAKQIVESMQVRASSYSTTKDVLEQDLASLSVLIRAAMQQYQGDVVADTIKEHVRACVEWGNTQDEGRCIE